MYDARQVANWFVSRAARDNTRLTIMQVLKLAYIAHGWHLEMHNSPLISNKIEAWKFGPVIPDVYNAFRSQGVTVNKAVPVAEIPLAPSDAHLLEQIYTSYGKLPAQRLSELTHEKGGPWELATQQSGFFAPITNDLIVRHYRLKRQQAAQNA